MNSTEFVAYLGAAAWIPQIISWIYRSFVNSQVTIVPDHNVELGYTSLGPIFNLRMAFSADRKDAIIDSFEVMLKHQDGEVRTFRWAGMSETFSEITDSAGNKQIVAREQPAIAFKIGTESLIEKFVRFQEPRFTDGVRPLLNELVVHFNYLKEKSNEYVAEVFKSKQYYDLSEAREKAFWWRSGQYVVTFKLGSPKKINLTHDTYSFELSQLDVDKLKQNLTNLDIDLQNIINSNLPDFQPKPISFNWANVIITKHNG